MMTQQTFLSIEEVRRLNLRRICEAYGVEEVLAKTRVHQTQLFQYIGVRPRRNVGAQFARRVEEAMGLPTNYMDYRHDDQASRLELMLKYLEGLRTSHPEKFEQFAKAIDTQILVMERERSAYDTSAPPDESVTVSLPMRSRKRRTTEETKEGMANGTSTPQAVRGYSK